MTLASLLAVRHVESEVEPRHGPLGPGRPTSRWERLARVRTGREQLRAEAGASSLEMLGLMLVAGVVVASLAYTVAGAQVRDEMSRAFCSVTGGAGCGAGSTTGDARAGSPTGRCVGVAAGASGPVRGRVTVASSSGTPVDISVMGDGTYHVSGVGPAGAVPASSWVATHLDPRAARGVEPHLTGGSPSIYVAGSPGDLAGILAADRRSSWEDSVLGAGEGAAGSLVARLGSAPLSLVTGGRSLGEPTATYTPLGPEAGLSLNAYDQTVAMDAGGEAVGRMRYKDGSTTETFGVSERAAAPDGPAAAVVPMLLEVDRDPRGTPTAVRTVTDRDVTPTGEQSASGSLYVTHVTLTPASTRAASDMLRAVGSTGMPGFEIGGPDPGPQAGQGASFAQVSQAFRDTAVVSGFASRQEPAGVVPARQSAADPVTAGLRQVMQSAQPQSFDGVGWTTRAGCGS